MSPPAPTHSAPPFRLTLLGGATLVRDGGGAVVGRATHRHRLALLALLACAPASTIPRERLIALLWPESDHEKGRNLLKVAVYELRRTLGDEAVVTAGEELRLDTHIVGADVRDLERAAARGDHAGVVAAYGGPFLDGFHLDDAHDFDGWLEGERARLATVHAEALERLAESCSASGDREGAVGWWKRRAALDPLDSRVAVALMRALDATGNRGGALQHAAVHERLLQEELGIALPRPVAELVTTLRAAPAIAVIPPAAPIDTAAAPVEVSPSSPSTPAAPAVSMAPVAAGEHARAPSRRARRWLVTATLFIASALLGGTWYARRAAADHPEPSVAVLPFVNIGGDSTNEYFSDGITEEIITQLAAYPSLKVISRTSAMRYKQTDKSLREIADELGVAHILEGSVRRMGDEVRIDAKLIDARTDAHRWAQSYDRRLVDALRVQAEIAGEVGRALQVRLGAPVRVGAGTQNPEAHQHYLRARALWETRTTEGHRQAIALYERAIALDSSYSDAYVGLADAWFTAFQVDAFGMRSRPDEVFTRMQAAAARAYALDSLSAGVHTSRAIIRMWERDWPGAEREFRRALELNPSYSLARTWYSILLSFGGRAEESVRESRRAWELDPYNPIASDNYANALFAAGRRDEAMAQWRLTVEIWPKWASGSRGLAYALSLAGRHDEAVRTMRNAAEVDPRQVETKGGLAYVLARAGQRDEARALLRDLQAHPAGHLSTAAFSIALGYVGLGEADSAFVWLEQADFRWPRARLFTPTLDPIRADPRFARLRERVLREMRVMPTPAG